MLDNPSIDKASGIAAAVNNPGMFFTHNNATKPNKLYLVDSAGVNHVEYVLPGYANRDWEDLASGPGPESGKRYLYLADIGDPQLQFEEKFIFRFPEPPVLGENPPLTISLVDIEKIRFRFPDGIKDAETMLVDPLSLDIYILSREATSSTVYKLPYPQSTTEVNEAYKIGQLPIGGLRGGAISPDGGQMVLKDSSHVYYWQKQDGWPTTFGGRPHLVPYSVEPLGKAICFLSSGLGYVTLSEQVGANIPTLYIYRRKQ